MSGTFDQFRQKIVQSVWKEVPEASSLEVRDDRIALGVLLWEVAQADGLFVAEEEQRIKKILRDFGKITDHEMNVVLESIRQAAQEKIDLFQFTQELGHDLVLEKRKEILEYLFRVALSDRDFHENEEAVIRKISDLLRLDHKDFIDAKIRIKKEVGLEKEVF